MDVTINELVIQDSMTLTDNIELKKVVVINGLSRDGGMVVNDLLVNKRATINEMVVSKSMMVSGVASLDGGTIGRATVNGLAVGVLELRRNESLSEVVVPGTVNVGELVLDRLLETVNQSLIFTCCTTTIKRSTSKGNSYWGRFTTFRSTNCTLTSH